MELPNQLSYVDNNFVQNGRYVFTTLNCKEPIVYRWNRETNKVEMKEFGFPVYSFTVHDEKIYAVNLTHVLILDPEAFEISSKTPLLYTRQDIGTNYRENIFVENALFYNDALYILFYASSRDMDYEDVVYSLAVFQKEDESYNFSRTLEIYDEETVPESILSGLLVPALKAGDFNNQHQVSLLETIKSLI